nr:RNA-binding protein [Myxococcota bacterium]
MRLFVGNLAYSTTEDRLRQEFQRFGNVTSVAVVIDRMSGRSRGFGFVEFSTNEEGQAAMNELNGTELDGREIVVNEARARGAGGPGGGGGGGGPRPRRS